jgi:hypothetical protein
VQQKTPHLTVVRLRCECTCVPTVSRYYAIVILVIDIVSLCIVAQCTTFRPFLHHILTGVSLQIVKGGHATPSADFPSLLSCTLLFCASVNRPGSSVG